MDILAEKLDEKLRQWRAETADQVRQRVTKIIQWADSYSVHLNTSLRECK
jgi:hypothetical protein